MQVLLIVFIILTSFQEGHQQQARQLREKKGFKSCGFPHRFCWGSRRKGGSSRNPISRLAERPRNRSWRTILLPRILEPQDEASEYAFFVTDVILATLGEGTFGKVVEVLDEET